MSQRTPVQVTLSVLALVACQGTAPYAAACCSNGQSTAGTNPWMKQKLPMEPCGSFPASYNKGTILKTGPRTGMNCGCNWGQYGCDCCHRCWWDIWDANIKPGLDLEAGEESKDKCSSGETCSFHGGCTLITAATMDTAQNFTCTCNAGYEGAVCETAVLTTTSVTTTTTTIRAVDFGCEPGTGLVTVQPEWALAWHGTTVEEECASSLEALVSVLDKCSEDALSTLALECKKSSSGKYGIVITAGQTGSTSTKRQQIVAGKYGLYTCRSV